VRFNEHPLIIYEPIELSKLLKEYRRNDELTIRLLNKIRMENVIAPILTEKHRNKIKLRNNIM